MQSERAHRGSAHSRFLGAHCASRKSECRLHRLQSNGAGIRSPRARDARSECNECKHLHPAAMRTFTSFFLQFPLFRQLARHLK